MTDPKPESSTRVVLSQCRACEEFCKSEFCSDECREYWDWRNEGRL